MDKAKQTGWDFFPSKAFLNFIRFSAGEIVKLKLLPALYLFGGPLWHNACSPSTHPKAARNFVWCDLLC